MILLNYPGGGKDLDLVLTDGADDTADVRTKMHVDREARQLTGCEVVEEAVLEYIVPKKRKGFVQARLAQYSLSPLIKLTSNLQVNKELKARAVVGCSGEATGEPRSRELHGNIHVTRISALSGLDTGLWNCTSTGSLNIFRRITHVPQEA